MNMKMVKLAGSVLFGLGALSGAHACDLSRGGFFAAAAECMAPQLAPVIRPIDRMNGALGRPFDHAAAAAANAWVPGSGAWLEAGWALQHSGVMNPLQAPQQPPAGPMGSAGPMSGMPGPFPVAGGFPGGMGMGFQGGTPALGNVCVTLNGAAFPGPFNPVGMPCFTPAGPGYVR